MRIRFVRLIGILSALLVLPAFGSISAQQIDDNEISAVAWSPDGSKIAIGGGPTVCAPGLDKYSIQIFDAVTLQVLQKLTRASCKIESVAWSPDGTKLAGTGYDGALIIWDMTTGDISNVIRNSQGRDSISWDPSGKEVASINISSPVFDIFDIASTSKIPLYAFGVQAGVMSSVDWSPDGTEIVSSGSDAQVHIWDAHPTEPIVLQPLRTFQGHQDYVSTVRWSPDGAQIASGSSDDTIRVWDASSGNTLLVINTPVESLDWHPSGNAIASGSDKDKTVTIWDSRTGAMIEQFPSKVGKVLNVAWSPDGTRLAYVGNAAGPNGNYLDIEPAPVELMPAATPNSTAVLS